MSFLDSLSTEQKETLISLPYRVGLWVSYSDNTGGAQADEQELQVLSNIINGFAQEVFGSEVVQYIMAATVGNKDRWQDWTKQLDDVPYDCRVAIDILAEYAERKDIAAFQKHMMEIGEAVAVAFSEYEHNGALDKALVYAAYYKQAFTARIKKKTPKPLHEYISISKNERLALETLAQALGTTYH
jgi:hypothetical protein